MPRGTSSLRVVPILSPPVDDSQPPSESEYEARAILDQRVVHRRLQYLIDWEGTDADGQPYEPTWEPEVNCSKGLMEGWKEKVRLDPTLVGRYVTQLKEEEARRKKKSDGKRKVHSEVESTEGTPKKFMKRSAKRQKIIESQSDEVPASQSILNESPSAFFPIKSESPSQLSSRSKLRKGSSARPKGVAPPGSTSNIGTTPLLHLEADDISNKKKRVEFDEPSSPAGQSIEHAADHKPYALNYQQNEDQGGLSDYEDFAASQDYMADFSASQADALHRVVDLLMSQEDQMDEPNGVVIPFGQTEGEVRMDAAANTSIVPDSQTDSGVPSVTSQPIQQEGVPPQLHYGAIAQPVETADTSIIQSTPQESSSGILSGRGYESREVAEEGEDLQTEEGLAGFTSANQQSPVPERNPLTDVVAERDQTIATLEAKIISLQKTNKNQASDLDFQRDMYRGASDRAVGLANDLHSANEEIKKLKDQLDRGLKQKDAFHTAQAQAKNQKIETLEKQVNLLLGQNRATNDEVRSRASDYPNVVAMNNRLRRELEGQDEVVERYTSLIETFKKTIATLRGPRMGRLPRLAMTEAEEKEVDESSSDEDFNPDSDEDEDEPSDTEDEEELVIKGLTDVAVAAVAPPASVDVDVSMEASQQQSQVDSISFEPPAQQLSQPDLADYIMCRWAEVPGQQCGYLSRTHEGMDMHVNGHLPDDA